jgi:hypothetical protein
MKLDSRKHAAILESILKVIGGMPTSKTLWDYRIERYLDRLAVKKALENHIKMDAEVLSQVHEQIR